MKALLIFNLFVLSIFVASSAASFAENKIQLYVHVPSDARVIVLPGYQTTSTGAFRHFQLDPGYRARGDLNIRVEVMRNGKAYELTHTLDISQRDEYTLNLDDLSSFTLSSGASRSVGSSDSYSTTTQKGVSDSPAPSNTDSSKGTTATVSVKVPEKSEIELDGSPTKSTGILRTFILNDLRPKQAALIDIKVEAVINGKLLQRSQTLQVLAGDVHQLDFSDLSNNPANAAAPQSQKSLGGTASDDPDAFPQPFIPTTPNSSKRTNSGPIPDPMDLEAVPLPVTDLLRVPIQSPAQPPEEKLEPQPEQRFPLIVTAVPDSCSPFTFRFEKKNLLSVYLAPVGDKTPVLILELLGPQAIACSNGSIAFSASRWINPKENAEEFLSGDNKVVFFHQGQVFHTETLTKRPDAIELQKSLEGADIFRVYLKDISGKRLGYTLDFSIDGKAQSTGPRPRSSPDKFWLHTKEAS